MKVSLTDQAYDKIEEMLVTLKFKPGTIISEPEIIERIGMGRTPVREALLRLAKEHMIKAIPRKGIYINEIHITDHIALMETRRALERIIAMRSANRATAEQKKELTRLSQRIVDAAKKNDIETFIHADHAFDLIISEACRNPYASEACASLRTHCRRFWYRFHHDQDLVTSAKLHAEVMSAIVAGNEERAGTASDKLMDYLDQMTRVAMNKG